MARDISVNIGPPSSDFVVDEFTHTSGLIKAKRSPRGVWHIWILVDEEWTDKFPYYWSSGINGLTCQAKDLEEVFQIVLPYMVALQSAEQARKDAREAVGLLVNTAHIDPDHRTEDSKRIKEIQGKAYL